MLNPTNCFLWFKDTKMKANHNCSLWLAPSCNTVSYGSKILKWKQITTKWLFFEYKYYCFLWFKDTKMKANHNCWGCFCTLFATVSYGSKILKWKQITTGASMDEIIIYCFLWFKDTKMKANHNEWAANIPLRATVSYGSKILKWKQITTLS